MTPRSLNLHDRAPQCPPGGESQSNPCIAGIKCGEFVSVLDFLTEEFNFPNVSSSIQYLFKIQTIENVFWRKGWVPSRETTLSCAALFGTMNLELGSINIYRLYRNVKSIKQKVSNIQNIIGMRFLFQSMMCYKTCCMHVPSSSSPNGDSCDKP